MKSTYQIVIVGAGTGGIMTASRLLKKNKSLKIAIIDPADKHFYQPAFTLVGAGTYDYQKTFKPMAEVIPKTSKWLKDSVIGFKPMNNEIITEKNGIISYEYLVISPGLVYDLSLIDGLKDAIDKRIVCSNYMDPKLTWDLLKNVKNGDIAIFTQPATPIKCGGAPQKIMYLAADFFRKNKVRAEVSFYTPGTVIFGVKQIAKTLLDVVDRYHINLKFYHTPVKIDGEKKIAYFKTKKPDSGVQVELVEVPFNFLHLAPPQTAPKFIKESELSNEAGWLDVNDHSMQHKRYPNIFGIGDVTSLPTAKTGAAVRKQVPVVVDNILSLIAGKGVKNTSYFGYSSCPLVTGYGKMVLAEFNYKNEFTPDPKVKRLLVFNSSKEHWRLWILKKYILPYLYWNKMLKGKDV